MSKLFLILLLSSINAADITTVNSGDPVSSTKMNEIINKVNNAGGLIKDSDGSHCAELRLSDNTYKATLVPINCSTKKAIGFSIRDGAYEIGSGDNLANCQEYRDHLLYTGQGDGKYWIDPDGSGGPIGEHKIYCDMDGSFGWTLILSTQAISGTGDRGTTAASTSLETLTPNGSMINVYTPWSSGINAVKFSCDGGKDGTINYSAIDTGDTIYTLIKNESDGIRLNNNQDIVLDNGHRVELTIADDESHPDFVIASLDNSPPYQWGTRDGYPHNTPNDDDSCAGTDYQRSNNSTALTTSYASGAYFYMWIR